MHRRIPTVTVGFGMDEAGEFFLSPQPPKGEIHMTSFEILKEYPDVIDAKDLEKILGICRTGVYNLMKTPDFPVLHVQGRKKTRKDYLLDWMDRHTEYLPQNP